MPISQLKNAIPSVTFLSIILIGTMSYWVYARIAMDKRSVVANSLISVRDTTHQAIRSWVKEQRAAANIWANTQIVHQATKELLAMDRDQHTLVTSALQARLRTWLKPVHTGKGYLDYFIIAPDNTNIASNSDQNIGIDTPLLKQKIFLQKIRSGQTAVSLPEKSDVPLPDKKGTLRKNLPTMFVGAPIQDASGKVIAIFAFRISPAEDFTTILQQGRIGKTGETYAFDKKGRLISNSRFDDQLRTLGLIPSTEEGILNIKLRDPGVNLAQGQTSAIDKEQQPLTHMASSAIAGESASNLTGYRDYRGITVVGAWQWDDELGFGITTEMDASEAYQALRTTRYTIVTFSLLLTLFSIGMTMLYLNNIARKRTQQALEKSEARLSNFFKASFEGIFLHENGKILDVNPATTSVFGYEPEETIGRNLLEFVAPESRELVMTHMAAGHEGPYEVDIVRIDGSAICFEIRAKTIELDGRTARVVGLRDITERKQSEKALQRSEVLERLATGASLSDILSALVTNAEKHSPEMLCSILLLDDDGKHLRYGTAPSLSSFYNEAIVDGENGPDMVFCGAAANSGERVIVDDIMTHPNWVNYRGLAEKTGLRACWSEPVISSRGDILGTFAIYYREPRAPQQQDLDFIKDSARLAGIAIDRKRTEEKTLKLLQQNRDLTLRMFQLQEQERQHLARELHDEFGQWLTAIQLNTQNITNLIGKQSANIDASIDAIAHSTKQIHQGIRRMIHSLRPALLDELGLADSLRELVIQWQGDNPTIHCELSLDGDIDDLGEHLNILIYRLAQESLTNVAKHAQASHVKVQLQRKYRDNAKSAHLRLTITDDGIGFDPDMTGTGFGLPGMRERVLASGGTFSVKGSDNDHDHKGTCIEAELFTNT